MSNSIFLLLLLTVFGFLSSGPVCLIQADELAADFDHNRMVNPADALIMFSHWLSSACGDPNWCSETDIDHSGFVDNSDFSFLALNWQAKDLIELDQSVLSPLQTLNITVYNVTTSCMIHVTTPSGAVHSFSGTIANDICTATYIPSYLPGIYQVYAVADSITSETEEFNVPLGNQSLEILNWQADTASYFPDTDINITFDLQDNTAARQSDFSGETADTLFDSGSGQLSILRKIIDVAEDGTLTARIMLYFDTTGQWSNIYAGTTIDLSLYHKDGSALPVDYILTTGTLNSSGELSNTLTQINSIDKFTTTVDTNFGGSDKVSYLDITIPPGRNVSDVIFSLDYVIYHYNTGWNDRIYLTEQFVTPSGSGFELTTGDALGSLGRLPIYLPLTPNENGLIYYSIHTDDLTGDTNLNNGVLSETDGAYGNTWRWEDYLNTTARTYVYVDKWGFGHDFSAPIALSIDPGFNQQGLVMQNFAASSNTYFPDEAIDFTFDLKDSVDNAVSGFTGTLGDSLPQSDGGALYVLRDILDVAEDGAVLARVSLYFDTTGRWSDIYAGTTVSISLYTKDGTTPLMGAVGLSTGFLNDADNKLSTTLIGNLWQVHVDTNFVGIDKIAYLDFAIPPGSAVSDVIFSIDGIQYFRNGGWADRIVIAGVSVHESLFPRNFTTNLEFQTGDLFPGLGRLPLKLPLNPNPNGFVFYKFDSLDIPENNINYGTLSETSGSYQNSFAWNDYLDTTARVFPYVDKWWYNQPAFAPAAQLSMDNQSREIAIYNYNLDSLGYTFGDTRLLSATVEDGVGNPINGLKLKDAVIDSDRGKLSIVTQAVRTTPDPNNVMRLLLYFDTTGGWSDIYAGTEIHLNVYGPDGKSGIPAGIVVQEGSINAADFFVTTLSENSGVYDWHILVDKNFSGSDRQVYLDFLCPDAVSSSNVVFSVNYIKYFNNPDWGDDIAIRDQSVHQSGFPRNHLGQYEFDTGFQFGNLGRFPLYLSLNPGDGAIFPKMQSLVFNTDTVLTGTLSENNGDYTYSHTFTEVGDDFNTSLCIGKYGYLNNAYQCDGGIGLLFSGEPRYLGGLVDEPVLLNTTWQVDLHNHFFVEPDQNNVEYLSSDPAVTINGNLATFTPLTTADTVSNLIITGRSLLDPLLTITSDPFTLYAAACLNSHGCNDNDPNTVTACVQFQCETATIRNAYHDQPQGVDLQVLNQNVSISNPFPNPNEQVEICATVFNTGTTNIFDVEVNFYVDDVNTTPIYTHLMDVLPTTYMDLPFRDETICFNWNVPANLTGPHRIWVELWGEYPLSMTEDMTSNNYAVTDFVINDPDQAVTAPASCPASATGAGAVTAAGESITCTTQSILIPITVQVCEDEIICGPVMGIELSFWNTIYWPSWSGYCQEFGVPQEFITDFIRTYETLVGLGSQGAGSSLPSLLDIPGILDPPDSWSDGWLPCHPEPTLFPYIEYVGVIDPGCGGMCPVSAWDCGQGVQFQPRSDSQYYNAYDFKVSGGARKVSRCHTESDYIEIPYQFCHENPGDPNQPFTIPFNPFQGGPGGPAGGFGGNGIGGPGTGPGGGPPIVLTLAPPTDPNGVPQDITCTFCSTGTETSNSTTDTIYCVPGTTTLPAQGPLEVFQGSAAMEINCDPQSPSFAKLGEPAPDFLLPTAQGDTRSLQDLRGRTVLLVFGNTRCPHCRERIVLLNQLQEASLATGIHVLFIASGSSPRDVLNYVVENDIRFEVAIDKYQRTSRNFDVTRVPECFLVDKEGVLAYDGPEQGAILWYYLSQWIAGDLNDQVMNWLIDDQSSFIETNCLIK